jgi:hypothetical protein
MIESFDEKGREKYWSKLSIDKLIGLFNTTTELNVR